MSQPYFFSRRYSVDLSPFVVPLVLYMLMDFHILPIQNGERESREREGRLNQCEGRQQFSDADEFSAIQ